MEDRQITNLLSYLVSSNIKLPLINQLIQEKINKNTPLITSKAVVTKDISVKDVNVVKFSVGQSNPTFHISISKAGVEFVLRSKPLGKLLPGAHQIDREMKCISALFPTGFPVPEPICYVSDTNIIGSEFYIMQYIKGRSFRDLSLSKLSPLDRTKAYNSLMETLAQLHSFDPKALGLDSLLPEDKRKESNMKRQLKAWWRSFESSIVDPEDPSNVVMKEIMEYLIASEPATQNSGSLRLVHGDYKLDNCLFHPTEPRVIAVLDWEIATLGEPLTDLYYCLHGHILGDAGLRSSTLLESPFDSKTGALVDGVPKFDHLVYVYCSNSSTQYPIKNEDVYKAYVIWRLTCIIQGVAGRYHRGNASNKSAALFTSEFIYALAEASHRLVRKAEAELLAPPSELTISNLNVVIPELSSRGRMLLQKLNKFMEERIYPSEPVFEAQLSSLLKEVNHDNHKWRIPPILEQLKKEAKELGLWNLFLPEWSGITHRDYATLAEVMGRNLWAAEVFNCQFPDTGNMETLHLFANKEQKRKWLEPLKNGIIRSAFVMTEPGVASSDATQISTRIEDNGKGEYVINGSKWWISGAGDPRCKVFLVLGNTAGSKKDLARHQRHSVVIVPVDSPGVVIKTPMTSFGYDDAPFGHFEVDFVNVVVPKTNLLYKEGTGFEIAQARLGPGRLHHCMRTIGLAERTMELMMHRMVTRTVQGGKPLAELGSLRSELAEARIQLDQARYLVLQTAASLDRVGTKDSRKLISMTKVGVPNTALHIIDNAIQIHGGVGLSHQFPLSAWYARTRTVRFMDGPDAVHKETIANLELREYKKKSKL